MQEEASSLGDYMMLCSNRERGSAKRSKEKKIHFCIEDSEALETAEPEVFSFTAPQKGLAWKIRFGSHELIVGVDDVVQGDGK